MGKKFLPALSIAVLMTCLFSVFATGAFAAKRMSNFDIADKLVAEKKIPMYVRDKGDFVYNPDFKIVGINGYNVNLRSQPNTKSNVVVQLSDSDIEEWPSYLGEWTNPNGEYWVAGEYRAKGMAKTVWIFGQYAQPMTREDYDSAKKSNTRLSNKEYKQMLKNSAFAKADMALNEAWLNAKNSLSANDFKDLQKKQTAWLKRDRDNEAKALMGTMSRLQAYTAVTNARAELINQYADGTEVYADTGNDLPDNSTSDFPDDLPSDLPDDLPSASSGVNGHQDNNKSSNKNKKINLASPEDAENMLMEQLQARDRLSPGETLAYLDTQTEINGETCWEFSGQIVMMNMISDTGRYAISPSGKIYEFDGDKYIAVK